MKSFQNTDEGKNFETKHIEPLCSVMCNIYLIHGRLLSGKKNGSLSIEECLSYFTQFSVHFF